MLSGVDAERLQRLADALIDRMRRNPELGRDLLGAQVLIDQAKTIELAGRQPGNPLRHRVVSGIVRSVLTVARHVIPILQSDPHTAHWRYSRH